MGVVVRTIPLGPQWQTVDPFLFCAHHDDVYPPGTADLGPSQELLAGRTLGQDFAGISGWNMYHGLTVPGFPQHPHRGFETVSFVRRGFIDHFDSLGATARFGRGDVQWTTTGSGIVHSEMFPLLDRDGSNRLQLFQIWINLPAEDKMVDPHFSMLWDGDIPRHVSAEPGAGRTEVTIIAGSLNGLVAPKPPPHSWAARPDTDVAIWHVEMEADASWSLPPAEGNDTVRTLYLFEGGPITVTAANGSSETVQASTGAQLEPTKDPVMISAGTEGAAWMLLQGRPIGEPVAQYGPFVLNDRAGIEQAFTDYQRTQFGGWPWPTDDPNHGPTEGRFAKHADGQLERMS